MGEGWGGSDDMARPGESSSRLGLSLRHEVLRRLARAGRGPQNSRRVAWGHWRHVMLRAMRILPGAAHARLKRCDACYYLAC